MKASNFTSALVGIIALILIISVATARSSRSTTMKWYSAAVAESAVSARDRAAMFEYWGHVEDVLAQAVDAAQSAYDDGNTRSMADNYLTNCTFNIFSAKSAADLGEVPRGWDDVKTALKAGLSDYGALCSDQRTKLYSGGKKNNGRATVSKMPANLINALHYARMHLVAAGADPHGIRLP